MKLAKRIIAVIIVLGLVGFVGWRIRQAYVKKQAAEATPRRGPGGPGGGRVVNVAVGQSRTGSVNEQILITGALRPKEQVDVTPKATGRVVKMHFHVGDRLRTGDLIAELDNDELQQQVNRAVAAISVASASAAQREAELKNAKAELDRTQALLTSGLVPGRDLEARQTAYEVVKAQVQLAKAQQEQAQAELNELKIRLEQTKIFAPMTGHVARRYVDVGALVNPSTPVVNIVNLQTMVVMANVPEREVAKLRVGNVATVHVDAFGEQTFRGRIARIAPVLDAATRSANVEVEIANPEGGLKAEMFARVTLDLGTKREAVLIPREALVYRGQQAGVYLVQENRPVFRSIETGLSEGNDVEVLGNLQAGVSIVTRGATMLTEGDRIQVAGAGGGGGGERGDRQQRPRGGPGGGRPTSAGASEPGKTVAAETDSTQRPPRGQ